MALELLALTESLWTAPCDHAKNREKLSGAGDRLVPNAARPEKILSRPVTAIGARARGALLTVMKAVLLVQILMGLAAPYLT